MIEVEDLSVRFRDANGGEIHALQSVSVRFEAGQFYTVIGPSGSGKTTLMQVIAGILRPSSGQITAAGVALGGLSEGKRDAWRRRHCGMIFQDFRLIEELSPLSNILVPAWFDHFATPSALRKRAETLLAHFNVPTRAGAVAMLSRGQQQRVAMARALLLDADIILADEPTASVDKANAVLIIDELERLAASGKTVICVSHDDRVAARADRVFEIEDGQIVGSGDTVIAREPAQ
jgi:putative ABC transport system ATP-binding protein